MPYIIPELRADSVKAILNQPSAKFSLKNASENTGVFGTDPDVSSRVTERVLKNSDKPVIVKLTPNVTDIRAIAMAVEKAGAQAVSLINTLTGMAIDIERRTASTRGRFGTGIEEGGEI